MNKKHGMVMICAWCREIYRLGFLPMSHGICPDCKEEVLKEIKEAKYV